MSVPRRIAHLDMDAYYASVELLRRPELRGLPLVIGGGRGLARLAEYSGRGVITTATYEARAFGLRSGMSPARAAALCPQAVLLPADFDEYRRVSRLFKTAVASVAPRIEDRGIDEIFIDLGAPGGAAREAARAITAAELALKAGSLSLGAIVHSLTVGSVMLSIARMVVVGNIITERVFVVVDPRMNLRGDGDPGPGRPQRPVPRRRRNPARRRCGALPARRCAARRAAGAALRARR